MTGTTPKGASTSVEFMLSDDNDEPPINKRQAIDMWTESGHIRPPQWLVRGFLEQDTLAGLFAPPSSGKSMLAVDLACSIASGRDWHGCRVKSGCVVFVCGEGLSGLKKRTLAWKIRHKAREDGVPFYCTTAVDGQSLLSVMEMCQTMDGVERIKKDGVRLVVVDTLARNFGDGDENSSRDMSSFIRCMDYLRRHWSCCVLIVHHCGHESKERARGSSAFRAAMDAEYSVTRYDRLVQFRSMKMKDADEPQPMTFELITVELGITDDDGQTVTSAVLDVSTKPLPPEEVSRKKQPMPGNYLKAYEVLRRMYEECYENLKKSGRDPALAKVENSEWKKRCVAQSLISRKNFHRIASSLEARKMIICDYPHVLILTGEEASEDH